MTYVLVPGAGGDGHYWHLLAPLLRGRGERVVVVDLPAADQGAGLGEYADAIVTAAGDAAGVTLVAQSMGAFCAPLAASRLDVRQIVLVNAMVPAPGESPGEWWQATGQPAARAAHEADQGRDPDAAFDPVEGFFHDVPDAVRDRMLARGGPQQADRPFSEPWPLDRWPDLPTAAITGQDDRLFPADFQRRLLRERLGITPMVIPGGHLVALSRPEALGAALG